MHILNQEGLKWDTYRQILALAHLKEGWNGYSAVAPTLTVIRQTIYWLNESIKKCRGANVEWLKPNVSASAEGEVVLWWIADDRSLNVYVDAEGATFHKAQGNVGSMTHTHGVATLGMQQVELMRWVAE